jgi:hypothetical protein
MATTVTMLLSSLRRLALAKYSVSNFDCFGLAPQQAAPRRLPIPKASAQCPARSSPSYWICFPSVLVESSAGRRSWDGRSSSW